MAVHAMSSHFSRRAVLRVGALTIAFALSGRRTELFAQGAGRAPRILDPNLVDAFLAVNGDGTVTIFCGKVDLGQGLRIAIRQMAAEELGITIDKVGYVEGDTALTPNQGRTSGSSGIQRGGMQIRQAAATARKALIELAARRLAAKPNDLVAVDGQVRPMAGGAGIRSADLIGERHFDLKIDPQAPLKDPATYSIVGKSVVNAQEPGVATGQDGIGGVVTGPNGPEAGVWVIAETPDLPTKFAKIVVTDDQGRYLIPDLPQANYSLWVRGYGLIDSPKVQAAPGKILNLTAVMAPNAHAAAQYYPAIYWYSMLKIPDEGRFSGPQRDQNMPENLKIQAQWVNIVKTTGCMSCHALGTIGTRTIPNTGSLPIETAAERATLTGQSNSQLLGRITTPNNMSDHGGASPGRTSPLVRSNLICGRHRPRALALGFKLPRGGAVTAIFTPPAAPIPLILWAE
jgi:hypothetical protein